MQLLQRAMGKVLGTPFVYNHVRPAVVGGIDMGPLYRRLEGPASESILDVGCGTGDALRYLDGFRSYLGVDTDPVAIDFARQRYGERPGVAFEARELHDDDVRLIAPTGVVLAGVLHHLTNAQAVGVLELARSSPSLRRVVTQDIVFVPGALYNNVMAMLDRGRHCRTPDGYAALARRAGYAVKEAGLVRSHPSRGRVQYFLMTLEPSP